MSINVANIRKKRCPNCPNCHTYFLLTANVIPARKQSAYCSPPVRYLRTHSPLPTDSEFVAYGQNDLSIIRHLDVGRKEGVDIGMTRHIVA